MRLNRHYFIQSFGVPNDALMLRRGVEA